jgi:hypothetical protein
LTGAWRGRAGLTAFRHVPIGAKSSVIASRQCLIARPSNNGSIDINRDPRAA